MSEPTPEEIAQEYVDVFKSLHDRVRCSAGHAMDPKLTDKEALLLGKRKIAVEDIYRDTRIPHDKYFPMEEDNGKLRSARLDLLETQSSLLSIVLSDHEPAERRAKALNFLPNNLSSVGLNKQSEQSRWRKLLDSHPQDGPDIWDKWNHEESPVPSSHYVNKTKVHSMYSILEPGSAASKSFRRKYRNILDPHSEAVETILEDRSTTWVEREEDIIPECSVQ